MSTLEEDHDRRRRSLNVEVNQDQDKHAGRRGTQGGGGEAAAAASSTSVSSDSEWARAAGGGVVVEHRVHGVIRFDILGSVGGGTVWSDASGQAESVGHRSV